MSDKLVAKLGNNANANTIIQGSENVTVNHFGTTTTLMPGILGALASAEQYEAINIIYQTKVEEMLSNVSAIHPLNPHFGVKAVQMGTFQKLVSTPLVEDALKLFPKTIKSTVTLRLEDYPGLCKNENIWDYSYRTQRIMEVTTKEYKEYLGDKEDPFPIVKFQDGMKLEIHPPEFPEAMNATLQSGFISYGTILRRVPTDDFGVIVLSNKEDKSRSFDLTLRFDHTKESVNITMKRIQIDSLEKMLLREKLIQEIVKNKLMAVMLNGISLATLDCVAMKDLKQAFFASVGANIKLLENLKVIEQKFHCHFDLCGRDYSEEEYYYAAILASSVREKWEFIERCKYTSTIANYDRIHLEVPEHERDKEKRLFIYELNDVSFEIQGIKFKAEKLVRAMSCAKMVNEKMIKREIEQRKEAIKMNFIPYHKGREISIFARLDKPYIFS